MRLLNVRIAADGINNNRHIKCLYIYALYIHAIHVINVKRNKQNKTIRKYNDFIIINFGLHLQKLKSISSNYNEVSVFAHYWKRYVQRASPLNFDSQTVQYNYGKQLIATSSVLANCTMSQIYNCTELVQKSHKYRERGTTNNFSA